MSLGAFEQKFREITEEGEQKFDEDFGKWRSDMGTPVYGLEEPSIAGGYDDYKARIKKELAAWFEQAKRSPQMGVETLCKTLQGILKENPNIYSRSTELNKNPLPLMGYRPAVFLNPLLTEFKGRLAAVLKEYEKSGAWKAEVDRKIQSNQSRRDRRKSRLNTVDSIRKVMKEGAVSPPEATFVNEEFRSKIMDLGEQVAAVMIEDFKSWSQNIKMLLEKSPGAELALQEAEAMVETDWKGKILEMFKKWLVRPDHLEILYSALYAYARNNERIMLGLSGTDPIFLFGPALRKGIKKHQAEITRLVSEERGISEVPSARVENYQNLVREVELKYRATLNTLNLLFEQWLKKNRSTPLQAQRWEVNTRAQFEDYMKIMTEIIESWRSTIQVEDSVDLATIPVDMVSATERFVEREKNFVLIQRAGGPRPKESDFRMVKKVKNLADALLKQLKTISAKYPSLSQDVPRPGKVSEATVPDIFTEEDVPATSNEEKLEETLETQMKALLEEGIGEFMEGLHQWIQEMKANPLYQEPKGWEVKMQASVEGLFSEIRMRFDQWLSEGMERETRLLCEYFFTAFWRNYWLTNVEWRQKFGDKAPVFDMSKLAADIKMKLRPRFLQILLDDSVKLIALVGNEGLERATAGRDFAVAGKAIVEARLKELDRHFLNWIRRNDRKDVDPPNPWYEMAKGRYQKFREPLKASAAWWFHDFLGGGAPTVEDLCGGFVRIAQIYMEKGSISLPPGDKLVNGVVVGKIHAAHPDFDIPRRIDWLQKQLTRDLCKLLRRYPILQTKLKLPEAPVEELIQETGRTDETVTDLGGEPVNLSQDELQDPPAYAHLLERARSLQEQQSEKIEVIMGKRTKHTLVTRTGQTCHHNLLRLLENPLEHTLRQAEMIVDQMETFLKYHDVVVQGDKKSLRGDEDFTHKFLEIGLMSGVEPGVVDPALKQGQAVVDRALNHRSKLLDKLDEITPQLKSLQARIEQYELGIQSTRMKLAQLQEELQTLKNPRSHEKQDELLNDIQRLQDNLNRVEASKDKAIEEHSSLLGRQARLDQQVASIEEHREAFQAKVLEAMQEFLSFTQALSDD